jgi:hypothetical protein
VATYRIARKLSGVSSVVETFAGAAVTGRPVVCKRLREPWASDADFVEHFAPVAQTWLGLKHPNLVALVEFGQTNGTPWVVQELYEAESLRTMVATAASRQVRPTPAEVAAIGLQLAGALAELHEHAPALVHGDIAPGTILVSPDGDVRLADLGIAAAVTPAAALGPARCEVHIVAPEQLGGPPVPGSDIFRLGLVFLELLTGRTLFGSADPAQVMAMAGRYPGLAATSFSGLPVTFVSLLAWMLARDPATRPSARDVENALAVGAQQESWAVTPAAVASFFARLFPQRAALLPSLAGGDGQELALSPFTGPGAGASPAAVIGKVSTKRMSADDLAAMRAAEAAREAKARALEWAEKYETLEGRPKDFLLAVTLHERELVSATSLDTAVEQAASFGSSCFDALVMLDVIDEDELLALAGELFKQSVLTGAQLLAMSLGAEQARLLPQDDAEMLGVVPLGMKASQLLVALRDPTKLDVLDAAKTKAHARSIQAVRVSERVLTEAQARVYRGKTQAPDWARREPAPERPAPPRAPVTTNTDFDLEPTTAGLKRLEDLLGPPPAAALTSSASLVPSRPPSAPAAPVPAPAAPPPPAAAVTPPTRLSDMAGRLFDAALSLAGDPGKAASRGVNLAVAVARRAGASADAQARLRFAATGVCVAALLEGRQSYEPASTTTATNVLGPAWPEVQPLVQPWLSGTTGPVPDPSAAALCAALTTLALTQGERPTSVVREAARQALKGKVAPKLLEALDAELKA